MKNKKVRFWVSLVLEILICLCLGVAIGFIIFSGYLEGSVFVALFTSIVTIFSLCFSFVYFLKNIKTNVKSSR